MWCCPLYLICGLLCTIPVSIGYQTQDNHKTDHSHYLELLQDLLPMRKKIRNLTLCVGSGEEWNLSCAPRLGYSDGKINITRATYDRVGLKACEKSPAPSSDCVINLPFKKCDGKESCNVTQEDATRHLKRCNQTSDMLYMEFHCVYNLSAETTFGSGGAGTVIIIVLFIAGLSGITTYVFCIRQKRGRNTVPPDGVNDGVGHAAGPVGVPHHARLVLLDNCESGKATGNVNSAYAKIPYIRSLD